MAEKSKILILGCRGFIGKALFDHLSKLGESEITGVNSSTLNLATPDAHNQIKELADKNTTIVSVARARAPKVSDPLKTFKNDLAITSSIAQFLTKTPVKKFVYLSSISVYGEDATNLNISEETKIAPSSHYGISKFTAEELLRQAAKKSKTPMVVLRPCMVYGPGNIELPYGPDRMVSSLVKSNKVEIFHDGSDRRDFLFIHDFVEITKKFIFENYSGIYNLGTGGNYSFTDVIGFLQRLTGVGFPVIKLKRTKSKIDQKLDITKLRELLKGYTFTSIEKGLEQSYRSFQNIRSTKNFNSESLKLSIKR